MLNPVIGSSLILGGHPAVRLSEDGYVCTVFTHKFEGQQYLDITLRSFVTLIACNICVWLDYDSAQQLEKYISIINNKLGNICCRRPDGNFSFHATLSLKTRFTGKPEDFPRHFAVVYKMISYALSNEGATVAEVAAELDRLFAREHKRAERQRARSKATGDFVDYFAE